MQPKTIKQASVILAHVHEENEACATIEMTPPHPPRTETPEYRKAHNFLINVKNSGCVVCGVTKRSLKNKLRNPFGATQLETHHYPIERSLADACDPKKVHRDFASVYDRATLLQFVDSPANLIVLCDIHHRSLDYGIHHLMTQDFAILKYLLDGYQIAATAKDEATARTKDDAIEAAAGEEAA